MGKKKRKRLIPYDTQAYWLTNSSFSHYEARSAEAIQALEAASPANAGSQ